MATVDVTDDSVRRFVVRHYRFDPTRRERRHVIVEAFDNAREFEVCLTRVTADIMDRRSAGERVDPSEHASGIVREAGDDRLAANGHVLRRAMRHGVAPPRLVDVELPRNMTALTPN